ncbi:uncharacterized protein BX663DRAFT_509811 [Cokeromyces recurvatus]|uniref:uncharacterized protein n=1 Tax=Cokeromyces recurvatus TaxID=90255 RepID=UPI002220C860|nr:uncharacterized protein BX663DRAFT_509811 [Cokeromyces recurvatus]KAI7902603.1 hypothetical protein BX663DRAFT_509811 [Cokeromyces recurvatus]
MKEIRNFDNSSEPLLYSSFLVNSTSSFYSFSSHHKLIEEQDQHIYPLTFENVSKIELAEPSLMPLARYWNEMERNHHHTTAITHKRQRRKQDQVVESPRLLPFPYHNDSYFLPTAEHDYPGGGYSTTDTSSMVSLSLHNNNTLTSSRLHLSSSPKRSLLKNHQTCFIPKYNTSSSLSSSSSSLSLSSSSPSSSLSTTALSHNTVSQKKQHPYNRSNTTTTTSTSTITTTTLIGTTTRTTTALAIKLKHLFRIKTYHPTANETHCSSSKQEGTHWYHKFCKLLIKKSNKRQHQEKRAVVVVEQPVWYSEFRCNPPPPSGMTTSFLS